MSSKPRRLGIAEAKARLAEVVRTAPVRRTIIQRRGKDVAVILGVEELVRLEEASQGATAGARLMARLDSVRQRHAPLPALVARRARIAVRDPFAPRGKRR